MRRSSVLSIFISFGVGLLVGVVARLWMRWISTDPEFTWGGTLGIVFGFGIFWMTQRIVFIAITPGRRKWIVNCVKAAGVIFSLQLFVAAGAIMLPTVAMGSLALWRTSWAVWLRSLLGIVSVGWTCFVAKIEILDEFGLTVATLGRIAFMVMIYLAIIRQLKSTVAKAF